MAYVVDSSVNIGMAGPEEANLSLLLLIALAGGGLYYLTRK